MHKRVAHGAAAAAAALAIVGLHVSGLDAALSALAFDARSGTFPLRNEWWLSVAGHTALKWAMVSAWLACLLAGGTWRRGALYAGAMALVVNVARDLSPFSCPWDLPAFGGAAPQTGRCLPAAHPLTGFAWLGLYVAMREDKRAGAAYVLAAALLVGGIAGAVQVARGAHFLSHVLWTAWTCWILAAALPLLRSQKHRQPHEYAQ